MAVRGKAAAKKVAASKRKQPAKGKPAAKKVTARASAPAAAPAAGADSQRPVGRPSKYDPALCQKIIELGRQGNGKAEIAEELDVHRDTLYAWAKEHPEFSDALKRATQASQAWWERQARLGITMPSSAFNAALFGKVMSARFPDDWRETTNVNHGGQEGNPVTVAPATKHISEIAAVFIASDAKADEIARALASR